MTIIRRGESRDLTITFTQADGTFWDLDGVTEIEIKVPAISDLSYKLTDDDIEILDGGAEVDHQISFTLSKDDTTSLGLGTGLDLEVIVDRGANVRRIFKAKNVATIEV